MKLLRIPLGILFAGSIAYSGLTVVSAFLHRRAAKRGKATPSRRTFPHGQAISVLKPLSGVDDGLAENLRSFFEQDYPDFELIFAVRDHSDPAVEVVQRLSDVYSQIPVQLLVTGEPPFANAKVYSLSAMTKAARHDWLVMSDSDIRVDRGFLRRIAGELHADTYDLATCPYRAIPGRDPWSLLEALGMNSEFWPGVLAAKLVEGVKFTVGPTTVARRAVLDAIPWESLSHFLAEDFVLGQRAAELGFRVDLSHSVVEHRLSTESFVQNLLHRLRWARSSRRSRPSGYLGQVFTFPLALAFLLSATWPGSRQAILPATVLVRALATDCVEQWVLGATLCRRHFYLLPIQDLLGFVVWLIGFGGDTIRWRGTRYLLNRDGTFEPLEQAL